MCFHKCYITFLVNHQNFLLVLQKEIFLLMLHQVTTDNSRSSLESDNRHQCKATNEPFFINVNIIGKRKSVTTFRKWGKLAPFNFKSQQHLENETALSVTLFCSLVSNN
jgi:hypothetical protein